MARILRILRNSQNIGEHKLENAVDCEYQVISASDGSKLLHLSTFGSDNRASNRKSSQSLQLDEPIARQLLEVLRCAFDINSIDLDEDLIAAYRENPERFRQIITNDAAARDVIAMAHRRSEVERFRRMLTDDDYFDSEVAEHPQHREEAVWQSFFEANPWVFGVSLAGQLLTSWSDERLEQVVAGHSISEKGKRVDALLRTSGRIRSLVFAEIKTHRTKLLGTEYRPGCWSASAHLAGAVAQVQGTIHEAVNTIGDRLQEQAADGSDIPGDYTYLLRPRSFLVIGHLDSLLGEHGGHHEYKIRSFELFRRDLIEPEILTFDELLARAEWLVRSAENSGDHQC